MDDLLDKLEGNLRRAFFQKIYTKEHPWVPTSGRCDMIELAEMLLHDPDFDTDRLFKILLAEWLADKWIKIGNLESIKKYTRQIGESQHL